VFPGNPLKQKWKQPIEKESCPRPREDRNKGRRRALILSSFRHVCPACRSTLALQRSLSCGCIFKSAAIGVRAFLLRCVFPHGKTVSSLLGVPVGLSCCRWRRLLSFVWRLIYYGKITYTLILLSAFATQKLLSQNLGFVYPVCNTPIHTPSRGILFHICTDRGLCPKTAHLVHKSAVICTLNITIFIFLIHTHCYSIKWLVKVSLSSMQISTRAQFLHPLSLGYNWGRWSVSRWSRSPPDRTTFRLVTCFFWQV